MLSSSHAQRIARLRPLETSFPTLTIPLPHPHVCVQHVRLHSATVGVWAVNHCAAAYPRQQRSTVDRIQVIAECSAAEQSSIQSTPRFSETELAQLWNSVSRSLLKLGKAGASESHVRSLGELLSSHKLVKVQLNGARDDSELVEQVAAGVVQQSAGAAELLQIKGVTMLFCSSTSSNQELLAIAEASSASTAVWKAKRAKAAADKRHQREAADAKRAANASASRKRIGQMISSVSKPSSGPVDKDVLVEEWKQLAAGIIAEENVEGSSQLGAKRKAPWKK